MNLERQAEATIKELKEQLESMQKIKTAAATNEETDEDKSSTISGDEKDIMMKIYDDKTGVKKNETVLREIKCAVRDFLIPRVKFVDTGKKTGFPTFARHDFSDMGHFLTKFVNDGCGLKKKNYSEKAKFWVTYARTVKKEFANHRSAATAAIKASFLKGEFKMTLFIQQ